MKQESWYNLPTKKLLGEDKVYVGKSEVMNGFGVFAKKDMMSGEIVEESPIWVTQLQTKCHGDLVVAKTTYNWTCPCADSQQPECEKQCSKNGGFVILSGGAIQAYNHDKNPHVRFVYNYKQRYISVRAVRTIRKDEELFHTYGTEYNHFEDF